MAVQARSPGAFYFHIEKAGGLMITENSRHVLLLFADSCVLKDVCLGFAPSQGKCALTSTVLRAGKGTELACSLSWGGVLLVALSGEQDQLWLSLAHLSDGDTEVEVEELMLFLEVLL